MITNKTIREVVIADKLFPGGSGGPTYDTRTASGAIATFNTNVVKPLKSLTAQIVPIQEGTGDPSPSNPRPISGTSVLNVEQRGKNLFDYSTSTTSGFSKNNGAYTNTSTDSRTKFYFTIQAFKGSNYVRDLVSQQIIETTGTYSYTFTVASSVDYDRIRIKHNGSQADLIVYYRPFNFKGSFIWSMKVTGCDPSTVGGLSFEECLLAFGTDSTYEAYTGTTYTIPLGRTVYGGSAEVVEGEGEVTSEEILIKDLSLSKHATYGSFYASIPEKAQINTNMLCECFNVKTGSNVSTQTIMNEPNFTIGQNNANTNVYIRADDYSNVTELKAALGEYKLVFKLATPTDFAFTGQEINSLEGVNNIWHDGNGDSEVSYLYQTGEGGSNVNKWLPIFYPIRKEQF